MQPRLGLCIPPITANAFHAALHLCMQAMLAAAGKADVLGSLEENDADADDQELGEGAADISSLAGQLGAAKIAP